MPHTKPLSDTALSMLDLVAVREGGTVAGAIAIALRTARHAESLGFARYWVAEHHNMPGIASSATAVLVGHLAGGTSRIRVGSGGIMLPNHSPLVVAEAFGTLAELYPGRIDLGLGRAPGTDQPTMRALRRDRVETEADFPRDVAELQQLLGTPEPGQRLIAVPGANTHVPIWLLGSSLFSAQLAATLGLPFAFASHFAPDALEEALAIYRRKFKPSKQLAQPYAMAAVAVYAADTDAEAARLFTSLQQSFVNLRRGTPRLLPPPVETMDELWSPVERAGVEHAFGEAIVGSPATVARGLAEFMRRTGVDELMVTAAIFEHAARLRSFELVARVRSEWV